MTPKNWPAEFLAKLRDTCNVRAACEYAGISRKSAYQRREHNPAFAKAWDEAIDEAVEQLELAARQRAEDVSDTLMIFLLKAHRPEKYRETIRQQQEHSGTVRVEFVNDWRVAHGATPGQSEGGEP